MRKLEGLKFMPPLPEDQRPALSYREYYAIRELQGIISCFLNCSGEIEKRVRLIPGGIRDMRAIERLSQKLLVNILRTIPKKKLGMLQEELNHTHTEVIVDRNTVTGRKDAEDHTYVSTPALGRILSYIIENECLLCAKQGKDVKRCWLRNDIDQTYAFDFKTEIGGKCCFAGMSRFDKEFVEENHVDTV